MLTVIYVNTFRKIGTNIHFLHHIGRRACHAQITHFNTGDPGHIGLKSGKQQLIGRHFHTDITVAGSHVIDPCYDRSDRHRLNCLYRYVAVNDSVHIDGDITGIFHIQKYIVTIIEFQFHGSFKIITDAIHIDFNHSLTHQIGKRFRCSHCNCNRIEADGTDGVTGRRLSFQLIFDISRYIFQFFEPNFHALFVLLDLTVSYQSIQRSYRNRHLRILIHLAIVSHSAEIRLCQLNASCLIHADRYVRLPHNFYRLSTLVDQLFIGKLERYYKGTGLHRICDRNNNQPEEKGAHHG